MVLAEGGRLYSQYRPAAAARGQFAQGEIVAALDAATGKTIWEHKYDSPTAGVNYTEGAGPHATPLITGNKLIVAGSRREFFALDKTSGKVLWSHDFIKEYGAPEIDRGMANSSAMRSCVSSIASTPVQSPASSSHRDRRARTLW